MKYLQNKKLSELTKKEAKTLSKNWSKNDWEMYLQSIEVGRTELLITPKVYDKISTAETVYWNQSCDELDPEVKARLKTAFNKLSGKQKTVLKMIFWEGLSERKVAKKIGVTRNAIVERKKQALQTLRGSLEDLYLSAQPLVREEFFETHFHNLFKDQDFLRKKVS